MEVMTRSRETNFLKWYYFPVGVFALCLIMSLIIIIGVILLARKYEKHDMHKVRCKNSLRKTVKPSSRSSKKISSCFTRLNNESLSSTSYFTPPPNMKMMVSTYVPTTTTVTNEYEEGDYECSENSSEIYHGIKCCHYINNNNNNNFMFRSCRRAASFDSYECYNVGGHDLASVAVSRSIEKLTLNVYVYFNIASENDYVSNYLLPCLKKCLTLVPDTKYILRPQLSKFITSFASTEALSEIPLNNIEPHNINNNLNAHILVLSDEFQGFKLPTNTFENCFVSLKLKNNNGGCGDSSSGSSNKTSTTSTSGGEVSLNASSYTARNINYRQTTSDIDAFKSSFRIYLNSDSAVVQAHNELKQLNTLNNNNNLIRKIYETSMKSTLSSNRTSHLTAVPLTSGNVMTIRNSLHIANDLFSSFGYNEKLQTKLEKYLEHICLKSNSFSNTNFSYVDYSKR